MITHVTALIWHQTRNYLTTRVTGKPGTLRNADSSAATTICEMMHLYQTSKRYFELSVTRVPSFTRMSDVLWKLKPSLIITSESIIHLGKQTTFQGHKYNLITKCKSYSLRRRCFKIKVNTAKKQTACPCCIVWIFSFVSCSYMLLLWTLTMCSGTFRLLFSVC